MMKTTCLSLLACALMTGGVRAESDTPAPAVGNVETPARNTETPATNNELGITRPSELIEFQFNTPGLIREVSVKEGDRVKKGDLMVAQDDTVEKAHLAFLEIDANSEVQVDAAKADLAQKKVELGRKENLRKDNATSASEYEQAKLDVTIGELKVLLAEQEKSQKKLECEEQRAKIELKRMVSTIDGVVQKLDARPGQNADPSKPQITVVKNDPLWIDMHIEAARSGHLKEKQTLQIRYPGEDDWAPGTIIFLDPVVDAQSNTQLVRLEMKNPTGRRTGLQVEVRLPEGVAAARAGE